MMVECPHQKTLEDRRPQHVAIIMDGNGRWAHQRGQPRSVGHRKGMEALKTTLNAASEFGLRYLTLYSFSSENWYRPANEVTDLMQLLRYYLKHNMAELHRAGICIKVIGERNRLPQDIVTLIDEAENLTSQNTFLRVIVALSYGARQEIFNAAKRLAEDISCTALSMFDLTENRFESYLETAGIPDPDLLIRTGGEKRLSNFLLWQLAYAEIIFIDTFWPDFGRLELEKAIGEFQRRERRYGTIHSYR